MVKFILGTATFATGYGVANKGVKLENSEVSEIVVTAQSLGINEFDTAPNYSGAESLLGEFLDQRSQPKISSKISKEDSTSVKFMLAKVKETLLRTRINKLDNLYLHDPDALSGKEASETIAGLKEIIALGLANRVGVSVYSLQALLRAKELFPELTVFQVPENICDRRLLHSSELADLRSQGNRLIVRSIFLQGLLLMSPEEVSSKFKGAKGTVSQLNTFANSYGLLPLDLCLAYGRSISWASGIIIGVASASQLRQIIESKVKLPTNWESVIETLPAEVLDPRQW
jgi:aryl-alcohol dehydrogenase-like predicted oxidoreductase